MSEAKIKKIKKKNSKNKNIRIENESKKKNKLIKLQVKKIKKVVLNSNEADINDNFSKFTSILQQAKNKKVLKLNNMKRLMSKTYNKIKINGFNLKPKSATE